MHFSTKIKSSLLSVSQDDKQKKCRTQEEHVSHASLRYLVPQANINTNFSLRTKWCLRGGVGGQFRRNLNWSFHTDLSIRWLWVFNFSNDRWFEKEIFRYKSAFQAHRQTVQNVLWRINISQEIFNWSELQARVSITWLSFSDFHPIIPRTGKFFTKLHRFKTSFYER